MPTSRSGLPRNVETRLGEPVREGFIEARTFRWGCCTPGFILTVTQLLDEHRDPGDEQIADFLTGNPCRCAADLEIVQR